MLSSTDFCNYFEPVWREEGGSHFDAPYICKNRDNVKQKQLYQNSAFSISLIFSVLLLNNLNIRNQALIHFYFIKSCFKLKSLFNNES